MSRQGSNALNPAGRAERAEARADRAARHQVTLEESPTENPREIEPTIENESTAEIPNFTTSERRDENTSPAQEVQMEDDSLSEGEIELIKEARRMAAVLRKLEARQKLQATKRRITELEFELNRTADSTLATSVVSNVQEEPDTTSARISNNERVARPLASATSDQEVGQDTSFKTPRWQLNLNDPGMTSAPTRKNQKKFAGKTMKDLDDFVAESDAFHGHNFSYFAKGDHRKVLEAALHFEPKLLKRWQQHANTLDALPNWYFFGRWLQKQIMDPNKAYMEAERIYLTMIQRENQSVQDFATEIQSVERRVRVPQSDYHRIVNFYHKVLPEIRAEFDKYADKLEDLDYDTLVVRLATVEDNIPERRKKLKNQAQRPQQNGINSSSGKPNGGANPAGSGQQSRKRRAREGEPGDWRCNYHKSNGHTDSECKAQKTQAFSRDKQRPRLTGGNKETKKD